PFAGEEDGLSRSAGGSHVSPAETLPAEEPALALLPAARHPLADPQLLQLQELPAGHYQRLHRHGGGKLLCGDVSRNYFTTKFTNFPGTTIVFTIVLPASNSAIFASARAAASMVA